jgi:hypothetical protein
MNVLHHLVASGWFLSQFWCSERMFINALVRMSIAWGSRPVRVGVLGGRMKSDKCLSCGSSFYILHSVFYIIMYL